MLCFSSLQKFAQGYCEMRFLKNSTFYIRSIIIGSWTFLIFSLLFFKGKSLLPNLQENTLQIYAWPEMFLPEVLEQFEKETGIKTKIHYYTTNEEMLITLKATEGKGYDLIFPSDYAVQMLIKEDLLMPLNKNKLNYLDKINPILLGLDYDETNTYALPYEWEIFGFGINTDYFKKSPMTPSWDLVFNPKHSNLKLAMVNDCIEAFNFAAYYLFGTHPTMNLKKIASVQNLLLKQKNWIETYSSPSSGIRADYLLATKNCHVALSTSSYIFRCAYQYPHVKFIVPKEWTFISIENIAIPKHSKKEEKVYKFLNFVYKPENLGKDCSTYFVFPATTDTTPYLKVPPGYRDFLENSHLFEGKIHFIRHIIPEKKIREIWVKVKS